MSALRPRLAVLRRCRCRCRCLLPALRACSETVEALKRLKQEIIPKVEVS
jgi:hypothetical protein